MTREAVEVVREAFGDHWRRASEETGELAALSEAERNRVAEEGIEGWVEGHFAEDVEYREDPMWPGASTYRGREQVKACFRAYNEMLRFESWELEQVADGDEGVGVVVRVGISPHGVELPVKHRWGYLCRVSGGRVAWFQAFVEPDEALRAAGAAR